MSFSNTGNLHEDEHFITSPVGPSSVDHYQAQFDNGNYAWRDDSTIVIDDSRSPDPVVGHVVDGAVSRFEYEIRK